MKQQITIDIPEGMEAVQETVNGEIQIKFVEKKLTYEDIENKLSLHTKIQTQYFWDSNVNEYYFSKKVEVLRKLTNIRNYFGKPRRIEGFCIIPSNNGFKTLPSWNVTESEILFAKQEHAQAAIDILGDELKYLFEPW